jgi:hypothetical protein
MSASTVSALQKMYKTVYLGRNLANQSKRKTPAYDKVPSKHDDFDGEALVFPFNQDMPVSVSPSFTLGKASPKASTFDKWRMEDVKSLYGFLTIDALSMKRARKDIGAFLRLRQKETNEIRDYMKMLLGGHYFWGDGAGNIGQVLSKTGTNPVTSFLLVNKRDAVKFHKGQRLQFNPTRTGTSGDLLDSVYTVTGINRGTGEITVTRNSGTDDPAANDYIYLEGSYDAVPYGVPAFITSDDPGSGGVPEELLGMDRTDDPTMKSGWRVGWQGSIEETAKLLCADMGQYFDSMDSGLWLSRYNWFRLEQELSAQGRVVRDPSGAVWYQRNHPSDP